MDPRLNPYTPNAGARPPALVGRDSEIEAFDVLLSRLRAGGTEQSLLVTGLRGVGKTVLLGALEEQARLAGWVTVETEITKRVDFGPRIAQLVRRALIEVAPQERWRDRAKRAASILKSFALTVSSDGSVTGSFDVEPLRGVGDSGDLGEDLTDLLVALGEAANEFDRGVALFLDEVQFLTEIDLEALITALHKTVQRQLPITIVGAGLPQLPRLAGEAKSYAERLFRFPAIGPLSAVEAAEALTRPVEELHVSYDRRAVETVVVYTQGFPYFVQEYGKMLWDHAHGPVITAVEAVEAQAIVEAKLDGNFFRSRVERASAREVAYLRAMAQLGPEAQSAGDVATLLRSTTSTLGPTRARLIDKGLLYAPDYGLAAFTVPQFDRFMRRTYPMPG
jgi:hypothetical protein